MAELAKTYGLNPTGPRVMQDAEEGVYNGEKLTQINELTTTSVDGKLEIKYGKMQMTHIIIQCREKEKL